MGPAATEVKREDHTRLVPSKNLERVYDRNEAQGKERPSREGICCVSVGYGEAGWEICRAIKCRVQEWAVSLRRPERYVLSVCVGAKGLVQKQRRGPHVGAHRVSDHGFATCEEKAVEVGDGLKELRVGRVVGQGHDARTGRLEPLAVEGVEARVHAMARRGERVGRVEERAGGEGNAVAVLDGESEDADDRPVRSSGGACTHRECGEDG